MTKLKDLRALLLKDPNVRKEYEALAAEFTLTDEQLAEVSRRRADPNRKLVSHAKARKRIKQIGKVRPEH